MSFNLPELPSGWFFSPLEECVQKSSISYGVVQPGVAVTDGVPIIRVNNFHGTRINLSDVMRITPEIESKYSRTRLTGGEVLLTLVGSVGQVAVVPKSMNGFNVARAVAVIHPLPHIDPEWIALCLRSPLSQHLLGSLANTTVQVTINLKDVRALPIPVPPEKERRQITEMLLALDNRIALLRETNTTSKPSPKPCSYRGSWTSTPFAPNRKAANRLHCQNGAPEQFQWQCMQMVLICNICYLGFTYQPLRNIAVSCMLNTL
jgi:type I restriction enzyme S subunit